MLLIGTFDEWSNEDFKMGVLRIFDEEFECWDLGCAKKHLLIIISLSKLMKNFEFESLAGFSQM